MSITVTDPAFAAALASTETPVQLRGPDGKVRGVYLPIVPGMTYPETGLTDDELRRLVSEPEGWVTADEVNARLRELEGKA